MLIVNVDKGNIEKALKQYKRKTIKTKQMRKVRDGKQYTKPSALNRLKFQKAVYLQKKSDAENKDK
jgi:small subunit ribosomal protein S21|tara:strand:+ start:1732 stop:1929 length:198 start_codon:yes stop_codon:yes gene_type:complete